MSRVTRTVKRFPASALALSYGDFMRLHVLFPVGLTVGLAVGHLGCSRTGDVAGGTELRTVAITLSDGDVLLDETTLLYDVVLRRESLPEGWHAETGNWGPTPEGLVGSIATERAAVIWCGRPFPSDVAVRFVAEAMPPHQNDANAFFRAAGSVYGPGETSAWIAGIAGWHVFDDGLEKHPAGPSWRVRGRPLAAGRPVEVIAGVRDETVFLWKDGRLLLERRDPAPLNAAAHDRVGLGTWNSEVRFLRLSVYRIDGS